MQENINEAEIYAEMNSRAEKNGVVFFGTDFFGNLPTAELQSAFSVDETVLNRSVRGGVIADMEKMLDVGVFALAPKKVFLNIGENDLKDPNFDPDTFLSRYEWLLYTIHNKIKTTIYVVSVVSDAPATAKLNAGLAALAKESGCRYIDLVPALTFERPVLRILDILQFFVRSRPLSFYDAMHLTPAGERGTGA